MSYLSTRFQQALKACADTGSLAVCYIPGIYAGLNIVDGLEFVNKHADTNKLMNQTCKLTNGKTWTCTGGSDTNADLDIAGTKQILLNIQDSPNLKSLNFSDNNQRKVSLSEYLKSNKINQDTINQKLANIRKNDFTNLGTETNPYYVASSGDNHDSKPPTLTADKAVLPLMQLFKIKDPTWQSYIDGDLKYIAFLQTTMVPALIKKTYPSKTAKPGLIVGGELDPDPNKSGIWPQVCDSTKTTGCYIEKGNSKGAMFPAKSTVKTIGFGPDAVKVPYYLGLYASMPKANKADAEKAKLLSTSITRAFAKPPNVANYIYRYRLNADGTLFGRQYQMDSDLVDGMLSAAWAGTAPDTNKNPVDHIAYNYGKNNQLLAGDKTLTSQSGMAIFASLLIHDKTLT